MEDTWLSDQDACSRLGNEILEDIDRRKREQPGSSTHTRLSSRINISKRTFSQAVNQLRDDLVSSGSRHLGQREVERRQVLMDQVASQERSIEAGTQASNSHSSNPFHSNDPWEQQGTSSNPFDTPNTNPFSDEAPSAGLSHIREQQQQILREQDSGLDALSSIIGRQKQMALDIGNEVDDHNVLIDDIRDHTDHTNQRITQETRHVRVIDRKSNTCWMWVLIILLIIAIVVVAVVPVK